MMSRITVFCLAFAVLQFPAAAQQRADPDFRYQVERPAFPVGTGPLIAVDAGHKNFHTADGRFAPFADLARGDGFQVRSIEWIDERTLGDINVLVVANAQAAFFDQEIATIHAWVEGGGALLLIADHEPFASGSRYLAAAFGFTFLDGYAVESSSGSMDFTFSPGHGLDLSAIRDQTLPTISSVKTFTGQAIEIPSGASSVLTLDGNYAGFIPTISGRVDETAKIVDVSGQSQGSVMEVGRGKIAVFGEAGAFTAQISTRGERFGMNAPGAEGNAPFVLSVLQWLATPSD